MEEKVIKIFENKLERLKDMEFLTKPQEAEEINLLLEYWKIIAKGVSDRENLLKDMLKDKEEKLSMYDVQLNSLKTEVEQLDNKNERLKNSIELQKLVLEKEKVVLEYSYKDKFEEKLRKMEISFRDRELALEKLKLEKNYLENTLQEKLAGLITREKEYHNYKENTEIILKKKEEQVEELEKIKKELEDTISLIASSKINMWAKETHGTRVSQQDIISQQAVTQQPAQPPQPAMVDPMLQNQILELQEKLKIREKENKDIKNKLDLREKEIIKEYEQKSNEEIKKQKALQKNKIIELLKNREEISRESLEVLARGFVHKIRNIYGIVSGATQLCQAEIEDCKEDPKKLIKKIKDEKQNLINELLDNFNTIAINLTEGQKDAEDFLKIARVPALNMQTNSLNSIIEGVCQSFGDEYKTQNISLVKNLDEKIPAFSMDAKFIETAFHEVILNAVEFMPDGGTLTVETKLQENGENVDIKIADKGVGIAEQKLNKNFQIFCTSKKGKKGVGLPMAQRYIEIHLVTLTLESTKGKGTTVFITMPIIKENSE